MIIPGSRGSCVYDRHNYHTSREQSQLLGSRTSNVLVQNIIIDVAKMAIC